MLVLLVLACGESPGTKPSGSADAPTDPSVTTPEPTDPGTTPGTDTPTTPTTPTQPDPCTLDVPDPGPPVVPADVGVVTVAIRSGDNEADGTSDETLQLCLGSHCFPLSQGSGDQLRDGKVGVWMFEGLALPRAELDTVALTLTDGGDHWEPAAMDIRFDGEPVYCSAIEDANLGSDPGQNTRWDDPLGLHQDCTNVWDDRLLTHGPMVMSVGPDRAEIWVRTDATRPVEVRIRQANGPTKERVAGWAYPTADRDFTASVSVGCLDPLTSYTFEVWVDGQPQGEHTFTTAPADGAPTSLKLAFGSCAYKSDQPIFAALDTHAPDLFAFVGDSHYGNTDDLDSLRYWYRWALERPERAQFLSHTPTFATWDDHDFVGNDTDGSEPGKDTALRVFREYWANPASGIQGTPGVFFASKWGDVDLIVLDDRYWRGIDDTLLGIGQHAWLLDQVSQATGRIKILVDGSQWTYEAGEDSWDDFHVERDELFGLIADQHISGVVLLSGDIHRAEIRSLEAPGYPIPEITSSPLAQTLYRACPTSSPEVLACEDYEDAWVTVAIDTTLQDPEVVATIHDVDGVDLATHRWTLSELGGP